LNTRDQVVKPAIEFQVAEILKMSQFSIMDEIQSSLGAYKIFTRIFAVLIIYLFYLYGKDKPKSKGNIVLVPGLPLIGNLMSFTTPNKVFVNMNRMADKYGSMIEMWIFSHRVVVISDITIAKEIMMKRPKTFCRSRSGL
jgi:hypothetical protein